ASYLVVHGGMSQFAVNGWLSSLGNASQLRWTAEGAASWVSHPGAYTCSPCTNYNLAPAGTNSACGSAANVLYNTTLVTEPTITRPEVITEKNALYPNPTKGYFYLQLPKKHSYTSLSVYNQSGQQVYATKVKAGTAAMRYNLPVQLPPGLYFVQLTGNEKSLTLRLAKD
ncbi:MAG TPA: T9SS type A sorting domain-containing protein, partial [Niastella sp.]